MFSLLNWKQEGKEYHVFFVNCFFRHARRIICEVRIKILHVISNHDEFSVIGNTFSMANFVDELYVIEVRFWLILKVLINLKSIQRITPRVFFYYY